MKKQQIEDFLITRQGYLKKSPLELAKALWKKEGLVPKKIKDLESDIELVKKVLINFKAASKIQDTSLLNIYQQLQGKEKKQKKLFFDIETSPNIGFFWQPGYKITIDPGNIIQERAVICICYKFEGEPTKSLQWDDGDDEQLLRKFAEILNSADVIIGHNCVTEDTLVLTEKLEWKPAGDLTIGEELVGFDEGNFGTCRDKEGNWSGKGIRKYKKSIITGYEKKLAPVYRITFDDGSYVDTTNDHSWLGMALKDRNHRWYTTESLQEGYKCLKPFNTWKKEKTYNSGYISGIIDADGTISKTGYYNISIYQSNKKNSDICSKINTILNEENIDYAEDNIERSKIISTTYKGRDIIKYPTEDSSHVYRILGSIYDKLEYIGKYQIQKGLRIFSSDNLPSVKVPADRIRTVVKKEYLGEKIIVAMQTSSKTFIGNGFLMHNCAKFDTPWIRGRALHHGIKLKQKINQIDTLQMARFGFRFNSNKLDYISKFLGSTGKTETSFGLWKDIVLYNDKQALKTMVEYCKNDVEKLEEIYNKLQELLPIKKFKSI